jgi:adenosylcobinamide-GDP ribazoletransferase
MPSVTLWRETVIALRFYSRLPLPPLEGEDAPHGLPDFSVISRAVPLAGGILGGIAGLVLVGAGWLLPPTVAALFCVAVAILSTGAFHEDGLADSADGLGGGSTRERKLEIMKDSRIGTYGASALILAILLRVVLIASLIVSAGIGPTALALVASGAVSRTMALHLAVTLPPARTEGAAFAAGRPSEEAWGQARAFALIIAMLAFPAGGILGLIAALAVGAAVTLAMTRIADQHLSGQTGDVAGATQQAVEVAILTMLLIFAT